MKKNTFFLFVFLFLFLAGCKVSRIESQQGQSDHYVVVLSLDGFRDDYPKMYHTPVLDSLAKNGVKSSFIPSFPSLTFPNHYSMATGLYPNNHGLVHNTFKIEEGDIYRINDRTKVEDPVFYEGEPIWVTAHLQGIRTASFYWVGSETLIKDVQPDLWKKFDSSVSFSSRADSVISWLSLPEQKRPRLIMWYVEEPDHAGHVFSPESMETRRIVENLDSLVGYFCARMNELPIASRIDFILVSDHGMAAYHPENDINLADYLPVDSFEYISEGAPTLLYPKKGYASVAYEILKTIPRLQVWYRQDVPEKYHYGSNGRIGELVVLPDMGTKLEFRMGNRSTSKAAHGFDNFSPEMRAIFYASGSSFPKGKQVEAMENVNLYLLICQLLGLSPAPNNGEMDNVRKLLK